jgi:GAF domain-containing protein
MTSQKSPPLADTSDTSTNDARAREAALREILQVISASRGDEQPVFEVILRSAAKLCGARLAALALVNDERTHLSYVTHWGLPLSIFQPGKTVWPLDSPVIVCRAVREKKVVHIKDMTDDDLYRSGDPTRVGIVDVEGVRTMFAVPLFRDGEAIGSIGLHRNEAIPFSDDEITLVETFAEQAVIAIENVRQFRELQTRLEREEATREILQVISASRTDTAPVFDVILRNAARLCDASFADLDLVDEDGVHLREAATWGPVARPIASENWVWPMDSPYSHVVATRDGVTIHVPDLAKTDLYLAGDRMAVAAVDVEKMRAALAVPLMKAGQGIGCLILFRQEQKPFLPDEIALVETFAEQAVIAIENVRQFREVQERLERERASSEVLEVISRSRDDEVPVFRAIMARAERLCHAEGSGLQLLNVAGTHLVQSASRGEDHGAFPLGLGFELSSPAGQCVAVREKRIVHIEDLKDTDLYREGHEGRRNLVDIEGIRTHLHVPLMRKDVVFGNISLSRKEPKPFTADEILLVETFAAQAVIAIENVRQFREVQERLEREEATREILQAISASRTDAAPVFEVIHDNVSRLCNAPFSGLFLLDESGEKLDIVSHRGGNPDYVADSRRAWLLSDRAAQCRAVLRQEVVHVHDLAATEAYRTGHATTVRAVEVEGIRTFLAVPLMKDGRAIGSIGTYRCESRPFSAGEVDLLQTFAAQAVIAIENVRQFKELETLNTELGDRVQAQVDEIERMGRLKRFLSPQVADAVVSSGRDDMLGSHRALIAILFCDIRGFTAFCESAEPEETIEVLQTFHETLGKLIHDAGAGFDHRAGDGIMVVFNDPVPCDDPVGSALRVAVQMRQCMVEICTKWRKLGHRMGFGVGISLGYATVGMVGFEGRYDYTASGTAVNLASRLCDQAADQEILLSQRAASALEGVAEVESAGELTLKGFHAPVDVFRVIESKDTL